MAAFRQEPPLSAPRCYHPSLTTMCPEEYAKKHEQCQHLYPRRRLSWLGKKIRRVEASKPNCHDHRACSHDQASNGMSIHHFGGQRVGGALLVFPPAQTFAVATGAKGKAAWGRCLHISQAASSLQIASARRTTVGSAQPLNGLNVIGCSFMNSTLPIFIWGSGLETCLELWCSLVAQ